ncbi:hypothetical protein [Microbispora siamensis]|uniref:hypothetical protein n=1 Tax=Microbispora siamensis TaxID=564413 RepID=UPI00195169DC|nr:hypothetical protein [Microbispora siamensis]
MAVTTAIAPTSRPVSACCTAVHDQVSRTPDQPWRPRNRRTAYTRAIETSVTDRALSVWTRMP